VKEAEACHPEEGTLFDVLCAYLSVPPDPLEDKFTVAVTFAAFALLFEIEEITGAVIVIGAVAVPVRVYVFPP